MPPVESTELPYTEMTLILSKELFWDVDLDTIDEDHHARFIIERVMTRGKMGDFKELQRMYSRDRIITELKRSRSLDPKTANFCSAYYGINKKEFKCYSTKESKLKHWAC